MPRSWLSSASSRVLKVLPAPAPAEGAEHVESLHLAQSFCQKTKLKWDPVCALGKCRLAEVAVRFNVATDLWHFSYRWLPTLPDPRELMRAAWRGFSHPVLSFHPHAVDQNEGKLSQPARPLGPRDAWKCAPDREKIILNLQRSPTRNETGHRPQALQMKCQSHFFSASLPQQLQMKLNLKDVRCEAQKHTHTHMQYEKGGNQTFSCLPEWETVHIWKCFLELTLFSRVQKWWYLIIKLCNAFDRLWWKYWKWRWIWIGLCIYHLVKSRVAFEILSETSKNIYGTGELILL